MRKEAVELLRSLPGASVLCVGDIMLDAYVYGEANRISPEAPVPVVHIGKKTDMPGGMGNVVKNLGSLGVLPLAVGVVGDDPGARRLSGLFAESGWPTPTLLKDARRPTTLKTRVIAGSQQVVRFDEEKTLPLDEAVAARLLEAVERHIAGVRAVAVSDYGKGVATPGVVRGIIRLAGDRRLPVVVDPKGADYGKYSGAALVTPNRKELSEAAGRNLRGTDELVAAARGLMAEHGIGNILITRSEEGMTLVPAVGEAVTLSSRAREVFDVSGAGDTVVAAMAAALARNAPLAVGMELANLAAGVVVGKLGTAAALPGEIEEAANAVHQPA